MKIKTIGLILSFLMAISLVLASCGTKTTPTTTPTSTLTATPTTKATSTPTTSPAGSPTATPTGQAKWWDYHGVPQYGGIFTIRTDSTSSNFDPYYYNYSRSVTLFFQVLTMRDWTLDRKIWDQQTEFKPPEYQVGMLAESWEMPDTQTLVFHIRKGVHWQDIPPVNGRELTAYDIEYHYHRYWGLGSGFTKKTPYCSRVAFEKLTSVTATDKYTVVFKTSVSTGGLLDDLMEDMAFNYIEAREAVEKWGDVNDWHHAIGTGPFILKDFTSGSSFRYIKNPNYWGYDERYPENRLPYADEVKFLVIPDLATSLAALRAGKIDMLENVNWEQGINLAKTNPELLQVALPVNGWSVQMRCDKAPFTDIRVRQALQMAIDLNTIAQTYYGGAADGIPYPLSGPSISGYYFPYDEWPQEVKDGYDYNPKEAKKLLAEAGYPKGFKTNIVTSNKYDNNLLQAVKSYFNAIGVDMEIRVMDDAAFMNFTRVTMGHDQMAWWQRSALTYPPTVAVSNRRSGQSSNLTHNDDPVYDAMVDTVLACIDRTEQKVLVRECDRYAVEHQWTVVLPRQVVYSVYQPWLKGYTGEKTYDTSPGTYFSRFWIDKKLKKD